MNAISNFTFHESHNIRIIDINGELWFVAADVANALDYPSAPQMTRNLDADEAAMHNLHIRSENGVEQSRPMTIINESGLYSCILKSRKPEAKQFKKWVTSEVLPSIRKTGKYDLRQSEPSVKPIPADKDQLKKIEHLIHVISHKFTHQHSAAQQLFNRLRVDLNLKNFHDIQKYQANKALQILGYLEKIGDTYQAWRIQVDMDAINLIIRDDRPWTPTVSGKIRKELDLQISQHPDWRKLAALMNNTIIIGAQ